MTLKAKDAQLSYTLHSSLCPLTPLHHLCFITTTSGISLFRHAAEAAANNSRAQPRAV